MAVLISPGVDVQIINEAFYGTAGAGTIPLIVVATAANKTSPSGSGIAPSTAPSEAGKVYLATSQRDLVQQFGAPNFYSVQGTQIHGHELNEYGLHGAYKYLEIANRAYVMRADIDLDQLRPSVSRPRGAPIPGVFWHDLGNTSWGVFQSKGSSVPGLAWESQKVIVIETGDTRSVTAGSTVLQYPKNEIGENGDFAVVVATSNNLFFEKIGGSWLQIDRAEWREKRPTVIKGALKTDGTSDELVRNDSFSINGKVYEVTTPTATKEAVRDLINTDPATGIEAEVLPTRELRITNTTGESITLKKIAGDPLTRLGFTSGEYKGVQTFHTADAQYPDGSLAGSVWIKGTKPNKGANWSVKVFSAATGSFVTLNAPFFPYNAFLADGDVLKDKKANEYFQNIAAGTIYVAFDHVELDAEGKPTRPEANTGTTTLRRWDGKKWENLIYTASFDAPTTDPQEGTLWYNTDFRVDVMVGDGQRWRAYRSDNRTATDPLGVILSGSVPTTQQDGNADLVSGDLWIDTSDLENYPALYRYDADARRWKRVDTTDQTTPFGVIFADARENSGVAFQGMPNAGRYTYESEEIEDMLASDFVDPDAPDARAYPAGMLLFNTRYSTYNVKEWRPHHFEDGNFDPNTNFLHVDDYDVGDDKYKFPPLTSAGRWVTASGNKLDGSPYMGRKAQRALVVRAMQAAVVSNDELRSEIIYFNLMSAPGYPELLDELISLNVEQKETAFIVSDTPARLKPVASELQKWAKNPNGVPNGEDGLSQASLNVYAGVYYPWGLSTNLDGAEVMIPASTIALSTIAYNDQVAYPWYAPAGFERGLVTAASTVGYLTNEGEFKPVLLNQGQRDTLYDNRINPIAFIPGRGLVVYGQKTLAPLASALDRINVARLANYLKYNLDIIVKPFLFQQNDQQTRDSAKLTVERFLSGLVTLRALEDFAVLCDTSNNTPERRDRNELWIDIAIKPVKAIEFIYVPVRIRNSADSLEFR